ncbi:hypothetical protein O203_08570 [Ectopseudomonas chengduensis]|nr:hypothetical protein O203_08570 [Pseudomonas chengduensis]
MEILRTEFGWGLETISEGYATNGRREGTRGLSGAWMYTVLFLLVMVGRQGGHDAVAGLRLPWART